MKIYLAHNFDARNELKNLVKSLEALEGFHVTSRWIKDDTHVKGSGLFCANSDIQDINECDVLVLFVDQFAEKVGKGKWFEWGYAYAKNKKIILFGHNRDCVFTNLAKLRRVFNVKELIEELLSK